MNYIEKAKGYVTKGIEEMSPADWRIIGKALLEGKEQFPSNNAFGAWKKDNGFGSLNLNQVAEALWLADDKHWAFFKGDAWHVRDARRAWLNLHPQEGSKSQRLLSALADAPNKTATNKELEEATGINADTIANGLKTALKTGKVIRVEQGVYRLPNDKELAKAEAAPKPSTSSASWLKFDRAAYRAENAARNLLLAGKTEGFLKSKDVGTHMSGRGDDQLVRMDAGETWGEGLQEQVRDPKDAEPGDLLGYTIAYQVRTVVDKVKLKVSLYPAESGVSGFKKEIVEVLE